jgi:hypothetical protein
MPASPEAGAYRHMISHVCDQEPRLGWLRAEELPELTTDDVALICRMREDEVTEYMTEHVGFERSIRMTGATGMLIVPSEEALRSMLRTACQHAIFDDVQTECTRRDDPDDGPLDSQIALVECCPSELLS